MSDDRYDQNGGSPGQPEDSPAHDDEEYAEDAKTQLVDLDSLQQGPAESDPEFAPPPTVGSDDQQDAAPDDAEPPPFSGEDPITSSLSSTDDQPQTDPADGSPEGNFSSVGVDDASMGGDGTMPGTDRTTPGDPESTPDDNASVTSSSGQMVIGGDSDDAGHDEATQFINVNDFAEQDDEEAHFTPEQEEAGYDGSTQFVDINALQAGDQAAGGDPIDNDEDLHRGYQFEAGDISRGEITLVEAQNALGKDVLLKRIWDGTPETMSTPLRERIAELNELAHPHLISMNGMFVSDSGIWIEIDAPTGRRLTDIIDQDGPLPVETALQFVETIGEVLSYVHGQQLAYANLTPDAVWVDADQTLRLEPFDMLRLEERGNLGAYGAPEMDAAPEERELSPATDVYSLAATAAAAMTGIPLTNENLQQLEDDHLVETIGEAMADNPADRPASVATFVDELHSSGGLNIKVVGGILFSILLIATAGLAYLDQQQQETTAPEADGAVVDQEDVDDAPDPADDRQDDEDEDDVDADEPDVALPETVDEDPRLTIEVSYDSNPPGDAAEDVDAAQLEEWRDEARQLEDDAREAASQSDRLDAYTEAMQLWTRIIEATDEPDADRENWRQLYERDDVQDELRNRVQSIEEPLLEGDLGSAQRRYRRLDDLDPRTEAMSFLRAHGNADVVEAQRIEPDDEDDDDEE